MILDTIVNVTIGAAALLHLTDEDPPGTHGASSQKVAPTANVEHLHSGVRSKKACRDFPRWDGARFTTAEQFSCPVLCQTGWCTNKSYVAKASDADGIPTYVDGEVGTYYTMNQMLKDPFMYDPLTRLSNFSLTGWSAEQMANTGSYWVPWDAESAERMLNDEGLDFPSMDLLSGVVTMGKPPDKTYQDACKRAGEVLNVGTWLMNDVMVNCEHVPEVVKNTSEDRLNKFGAAIRRLWLEVCQESPVTPYNFTCYAQGRDTMLWDANFDASTYGIAITSHFNLPWDVACCCCGGGTTKNQPGGKMRFFVSKSWWSIAAKLTSPTPNQSLFASFVTDGFIDTEKHKDWQEVLYPNFTDKVRQSFNSDGLVYTFPLETYSPTEVDEYPYDSWSVSSCEDYQLVRDIENSTLQYKNMPYAWAGWAGYTCRYYHYNGACDPDGKQSPDDLSRFGPAEQYYNGLIKESIVSEWSFPGVRPNISLHGMRRADALKVCCACGGGKRPNREAPKSLIDVFADAYYTEK